MPNLVLRELRQYLVTLLGDEDYSNHVIHPFGFEQVFSWIAHATTFRPRNIYVYTRQGFQRERGIDIGEDLKRLFPRDEISLSIFDGEVKVFRIGLGTRIFLFEIDCQGSLIGDYANYVMNFPIAYLKGVLWESRTANHDGLTVRRLYQMIRVCWNVCHGEDLVDRDLIALSERLLDDREAAVHSLTSKSFEKGSRLLQDVARHPRLQGVGQAMFSDFSTGKLVSIPGTQADPGFVEQIAKAYAAGLIRLAG